MTGSRWAILIGTALGSMIAVLVGADIEPFTWEAILKPIPLLPALGAGAASVVAFFSQSPTLTQFKSQWKGTGKG